jgi:hypothetical protein
VEESSEIWLIHNFLPIGHKSAHLEVGHDQVCPAVAVADGQEQRQMAQHGHLGFVPRLRVAHEGLRISTEESEGR